MKSGSPPYNGLALSAETIVRQAKSKRTAQTRTETGAAPLILGVWLSGVFAASVLGRAETHGFAFTAILAASILWPALYFLMRAQFVPRFPSRGARTAVWVFAVCTAASVFGSPIVWTSFAYYLLTLCAIFLALQFDSALSSEQYRKGLSLYALLGSSVLIYFAVRYYQPGVRLGNGGVMNPNSIGMVALSVVVTSFAGRGWIRRLATLIPALTVLLLTDSRSAALGTAIALTIIFWGECRGMGGATKALAVLGAAAAIVAAALYWDHVIAVIERFFAVNSHYRGVGTGATGRLQAWWETWGLFIAHPLFGVGFRAHDVLITSESSAHNGYLALLAEIGIIGFTSVMYLLISGVLRLKRQLQARATASLGYLMLALCAGYCFIGIFERYLINVGNPTSLMFLLALLSRERSPTSEG